MTAAAAAAGGEGRERKSKEEVHPRNDKEGGKKEAGDGGRAGGGKTGRETRRETQGAGLLGNMADDEGPVAALDARDVFDEEDDELGEEVKGMSTDDLVRRTRLIDNEIRVLKVRPVTTENHLFFFHLFFFLYQ